MNIKDRAPSKRPNIYALDAMRAVAILAVVMIHTTSRTLEFFHYDLYRFPFTLFLNQFSRFAVPLFFLISGFVLELNHEGGESYWQYLKRRANRIIIPYIFWSAVYYFLFYRSDPDSFIRALLTGSASYQLYFIPSLIVLYLFFPLFHRFYKYIANKWIFALFGIAEVFILHRAYVYKDIFIPFPIAVALFNYYVFFVGMVASQNYKRLLLIFGKLKYLLIIATIGLSVYLFWQGKSVYYQTWNIDAFYSQWRPSVLLYTLLFAATTFYYFEKGRFGEIFFKIASKLSFFVFFAHVIVLEEVWKFISPQWRGWYDLPFFLEVSFATFLIALLLHKIPYLSKLAG